MNIVPLWHEFHAGPSPMFVGDYDRRHAEILRIKPVEERATRFRFMKPVKAVLGDQALLAVAVEKRAALGSAWDAFGSALAALDSARAALGSAWDAYDSARAAYGSAWDAYDSALTAYRDSIPAADLIAAHDAECEPDCPYRTGGTNIFKDGRP